MRLTLKDIRRIIFLLILFVLVGYSGYSLGKKNARLEINNFRPSIKLDRTVPQTKSGKVEFTQFWEVWDKVENSYYDKNKVDYQKMVYGAISGMVSALGDPYTVFLPPVENGDAKADLRGDFEGVGIQIGYDKEQRVSVIAPISGTPAEAAGLKAGDVILKIVDEEAKVDKSTEGLSLPEAVKIIRGPKGTLVKLTIGREGTDKPFEVNLKRATIVVKSVELKIENNAAIIKLSRFGERTYEEWQEAISTIINEKNKNKNFKGIVLDMRNNPGGFLQGAVYIASEFISSGTVVQQDKGPGGIETYTVNRKGDLLKDPLVVLINEGSASASEIVAGALQDWKRAKLVGIKSFGKGTVQEAQDLDNGAGLHVTIARWLTPTGKSIDKEGIKPDVEIKMDEKDATKDPQLQEALRILTQ